jgi:hypothetical protein
LRKTGVEPSPIDTQVAALVRRIANGEEADLWDYFPRTERAVHDVVAEGADPSRRGGASGNRVWTGETDGAIAPFWQTTLSPDPQITAKDRLKALRALDDIGALPRCTCEPEPKHQLVEEKYDASDAHTVRLVAQKHYRAALHIARYPETYLAVRDAIDARIVSELGQAREGDATAAAS